MSDSNKKRYLIALKSGARLRYLTAHLNGDTTYTASCRNLPSGIPPEALATFIEIYDSVEECAEELTADFPTIAAAVKDNRLNDVNTIISSIGDYSQLVKLKAICERCEIPALSAIKARMDLLRC